MAVRKALLQALEDKFNAEISAADVALNIYLDHPVGIGEHPQFVEECDKLIAKIFNCININL